MLHYKQETGDAVVIDAREAAPGAATERMFVDNPELSLAGNFAVRNHENDVFIANSA